jgi:hypothetical protein
MSRRRSRWPATDVFGFSLADILTTALGCVLLLFLVAVFHIRTTLSAEKSAHENTLDQLQAEERGRGQLAAALGQTRNAQSEAQLALAAADAKRRGLEQDLAALRARYAALQGAAKDAVDELDPRTARPVDVVLVIDGTRSMKPSLDATRRNLEAAAEALRVVSPTARVGVVVYRDKREREGVRLQSHDLTDDEDDLAAFLSGIKATSSRRDTDLPEWLCGALDHAVDAEWRSDAIKLIIATSDAAAQDPGAKRCLELARSFREDGGQIHMLTTRPRGMRKRKVRRDFKKSVLPQHAAIAKAGGGLHVEQADADALLTALLRAAYAERAAAPLEKLRDAVEKTAGEDRP